MGLLCETTSMDFKERQKALGELPKKSVDKRRASQVLMDVGKLETLKQTSGEAGCCPEQRGFIWQQRDLPLALALLTIGH